MLLLSLPVALALAPLDREAVGEEDREEACRRSLPPRATQLFDAGDSFVELRFEPPPE